MYSVKFARMIYRDAEATVLNLMREFPAVGILGPRQVGKTTLALQIASTMDPVPIYLDLEAASDITKISEPELYFQQYEDRAFILDEIQRAPNIFSALRGVIDHRKRTGRRTGQFLILGSASLDLLKQSSETLAGRIAYTSLTGFKPVEIQPEDFNRLWLRGGFPDSFLASDDASSFDWRQAFISTYLERDVPQFGLRIPASSLRSFWTMLAHVQGGLLNLSVLSSGLALSVPTLARYLELLDDLFLVRKLQPWSSNLGKRLVKTPKIYIRDSGLYHSLLRIRSLEDLLSHPSLGGSWEGFIIESLLADLPPHAAPYFYRTSAGAEIDLVIDGGNKLRIALEIKRSLSPVVSKGFEVGCQDLEATHKYYVYPGDTRFPMKKEVTAIPVVEMILELKKLLA